MNDVDPNDPYGRTYNQVIERWKVGNRLRRRQLDPPPPDPYPYPHLLQGGVPAMPLLRARGGEVPAYLSKGEYVMSKDSVAQHGVGFMNRLNKGGEVPRFHNGGFVGPQYLQNGGDVNGGQEIVVKHEGSQIVTVGGLEALAKAVEGSSNEKIGQGVANGLRAVADKLDGSDGSPQSTSAALREGAESQIYF